MTSVANQQQQQQPQSDDADTSTAATEPPMKKRRGGRRTSNPEISAEERKRLRILKNRESAMRSLAKKAEYSAKLEALQKQAVEEYRSTRESLEQLIPTALSLKAALDKTSSPNTDLIARAEVCISSATATLTNDTDQALTSAATQATIAASVEQNMQARAQSDIALIPSDESARTRPTTSAAESQTAVAAPTASDGQSALDSDLIMSSPNASNSISNALPPNSAENLAESEAISMPSLSAAGVGTVEEDAVSK